MKTSRPLGRAIYKGASLVGKGPLLKNTAGGRGFLWAGHPCSSGSNVIPRRARPGPSWPRASRLYTTGKACTMKP